MAYRDRPANAKLTPEQIAAIRHEYAKKKEPWRSNFRGDTTIDKLAEKYGVSRSVIHFVIRGGR